MKIYCIDMECQNKPKGYAICTALMDMKECPKRLVEEGATHEEVSKGNSDIQM